MKKLIVLALASAVTVTTSLAHAERSGKEVYDSKCVACHATGVAGAPKTGDSATWKDRTAKGKETLLKNAKSGLNAMPPMGTCMDCSDAELQAAIDFMLPK